MDGEGVHITDYLTVIMYCYFCRGLIHYQSFHRIKIDFLRSASVKRETTYFTSSSFAILQLVRIIFTSSANEF